MANMARSRVLLEITEGWTHAEPLRLYDNGVTADLTGKTVAVTVHDKNRAVVSGVTVTKDSDQVANPGRVWLTPSAGMTNALSPFDVHFVVTDGASTVVLYPNGAAGQIVVYKP